MTVNFFVSKIVLFIKKTIFYSFLQKSCLHNFEFGGTLFSKVMSNFCRPQNSQNTATSSFFDEIKLILYLQIRNSMTQLTLIHTQKNKEKNTNLFYFFILQTKKIFEKKHVPIMDALIGNYNRTNIFHQCFLSNKIFLLFGCFSWFFDHTHCYLLRSWYNSCLWFSSGQFVINVQETSS